MQPLYEEFENIVVQYFSFFRSTLHSINKTDIELIVNDLKKQRNDYIQARIKVVSMSEAIKENSGNTDVLEFCEALKGFFFVNKENALMKTSGTSMFDDPAILEMLYENSMSSGGGRLIHTLERHLRKKRFDSTYEVPVENIMFYIEEKLSKMEESWSTASSIYAKLRVNYLLSNRI